jgi:tetratricopeptide (TPR) repeat protein
MKTNSGLLSILPVALLTIFAGTAVAQGTVPAGGGAGTETRPDSIQDTGYFGYMANAPGGVVAGGILQGKVVLAGNPLLWEPLTVMLSCTTGKASLTTQTSADGSYAITHVNLPKAYTTEDDALSIQMSQHYEGCTLQAPLAGYHSSSITITQKNLRDKPVLDNIVLTVDEHAPGTAISSAGESASPEAVTAFDKAHQDWLHRNPDGTEKELKQAVELDPQFAEAWYLLGRLQIQTDLNAAEGSFRKAQGADPKFVPPCIMLAGIAVQQKHWQEARNWADQALALDPAGTAQLWYYAAQADYHIGRNEAALSSAEKALALDPEHGLPNTEDLLALALADKGDYADAAQHLRNCLGYVTSGPSVDLIKRQLAYVEQQSTAAKR